jgi:hypothetical protein
MTTHKMIDYLIDKQWTIWLGQIYISIRIIFWIIILKINK